MGVDVFNCQTYKAQAGIHQRLHAKYLDKNLGYKIAKIENKLLQRYRAYDKFDDLSNKKQHYPGTQAWIGLHPQALQTTYNQIYEAFLHISNFEIDEVVDIGAGYGRVGLVMNSIKPKAKFTGFEIVKERQKEGNRIYQKYGLNNCKILNEDVLNDNFQLPIADVYFIYDFSELGHVSQLLDILRGRMSQYKFSLITHGDRIDYLISRKFREFWKKNGYLTIGDLKIYSSVRELSRRKNYGNRKSKVF